MVGGLVSSTLFTLLVLPAVYARFGQGRHRKSDGSSSHEVAK
jgi:Cu/Ag efflux pump CusA